MLLGDASGLYDGDLRRLTRIIRAAITFFGVLLLAVIAFAGWSANKTASDIERTLVENALNQSIAAVLNGQKSVAWWDEAVINTADGALNLEFADAEFGIYLTETYGHNEIYVLDGRDRPIYAYVDGDRAKPESYETKRAELGPVVAEARNGVSAASSMRPRSDEFGRAQTSYKILSRAVKSAKWAGHIISLGGRPAVVAAIHDHSERRSQPSGKPAQASGQRQLHQRGVHLEDCALASPSGSQSHLGASPGGRRPV